jgi:hypothetical protein
VTRAEAEDQARRWASRPEDFVIEPPPPTGAELITLDDLLDALRAGMHPETRL